MRADTIEPGDVLIDPATGATIYTVVRPLYDHWREGLAVLVRYEVDGGTDVRCFDPEQDVPLSRVRPTRPSEPEPPSALAGSPTETEVATYDREQAERQRRDWPSSW